MTTPFIDSLAEEQKALVRKASRGSRRPSYYSAQAAQAKDDALRSRTELPDDFAAEVQISLDLEAALILLPRKTKDDLVGFIREVLLIIGTAGQSDDLSLFEEIVAVRAGSYVQVNQDIAGPLLAFDQTRQDVFDFLTTRQAARSLDTAVVLLPDLNGLFAAVSDDYQRLATIDVLAVHDRIADAGTLGAYADAGFDRQRELTSWATVLTTYL